MCLYLMTKGDNTQEFLTMDQGRHLPLTKPPRETILLLLIPSHNTSQGAHSSHLLESHHVSWYSVLHCTILYLYTSLYAWSPAGRTAWPGQAYGESSGRQALKERPEGHRTWRAVSADCINLQEVPGLIASECPCSIGNQN